ncbi:MAG TPA: outer membrane beta-barrel protein [Chitinophagaceae bacterium]|jgi:outer membrane protein with beta-barrel domain|nr:outer membrane beta-barrel protein [Chitinophagaceae bacterium]
MLYIHRREIGSLRICFVSFILLLIASGTFAQERELYLTDHDSKPYYFGITLGANVASFHIEHHPRFLQYDSVYTVNPEYTAGFQLGLLATARISNRFEVRFNPQLLFTDRGLTYKLKYTDLFEQSDSVTKKIESVITTFPLQIKFFSDRIGNFRVYMLAGVKADIDLASNARAKRAEELVKIQKYDYGVEAGIGFNFYFPSFILSPEIKISNGLKNIHSRDENLKYSNVLDRITSRMIVFCIHLEG